MIVCNAREFERNPEWGDRQEPFLLSLKNKLYVVGGRTAAIYDDMWRSDKGKYWEVISTASSTYNFQGVATLNNIIYGLDDDGTVYSHDGETSSSWTSIGLINNSNDLYVIDNKLYRFGGITYVNDILRSSDGITWETVNDNPGFSARAYQKFFELSGEYYLWGGFNGSGTLTDVWKSSDLKTWTEITPVNLPDIDNQTCITFTKNNRAWIAFGKDSSGDINTKVYSTSDFIKFREEYIDTNISLEKAGVLVKDNNVYLAGGIFQGVLVDENQFVFYDELDQALLAESYINDIIRITTYDIDNNAPANYDYITTRYDRWDSLAVKHYGDVAYVNFIFENNKHIKKEQIKSVFCESGIKLVFPAISAENDIPSSQKTEEPVAWWKAE